MQDHVKPELLFVGTEFGVYFTVDEGIELDRSRAVCPPSRFATSTFSEARTTSSSPPSAGASTSSTTTRPLRQVSDTELEQDAILFPTKDALRYVEKRSRVGSRGATFYTADNPRSEQPSPTT